MTQQVAGTVRTDVPSRLDRLPWARWHWLVLTLAWCAIFFLASAGASAAYLTVSEIFPMETRAMAIALFCSIGTGLGGIVGPYLFAKLVDTGELSKVANGYYLGAAVMILGGLMELFLGVDAEGKSLEEIAEPLSAERA